MESVNDKKMPVDQSPPVFEVSKTPTPVALGGELAALPTSVQLYMEARKKRYPTKERMQKEEREIRMARGELVDIPSFEYLVNDFKKQKKRGGKHGKSQSQPNLLNKLFQKTVVAEHVGLLQCIRYLVAHNFLAAEGEVLPASDNPARQREVFGKQGGAKKEWNNKGANKNRKRQFPKDDAMNGIPTDASALPSEGSVGTSNNNNDAVIPDGASGSSNFDRKNNKWQNKKRKFDSKNTPHQQNARQSAGPRSIIGYPANPDQSQQPTTKQDASPIANILTSNNNNSAPVTPLSFPPRPVHSQSLPLPVFAAPPPNKPHSHQHQHSNSKYGHHQRQHNQQYQQYHQPYLSQQQPLIPPPFHATQAWPQQQQYQMGMYPPPSLQNQQLPSPNFAATHQPQQGNHSQQHQQRPSGQSAEELRRKIKMMNASQ